MLMDLTHAGIADRIKHRRGLLLMERPELAARVGVTAQSLHDWENGHYVPRYRNITKLAKALECNPVWLAFGLGDPGFTEDPQPANGAQ
jgi:transcriptional regulator with XRE-family HTH domain